MPKWVRLILFVVVCAGTGLSFGCTSSRSTTETESTSASGSGHSGAGVSKSSAQRQGSAAGNSSPSGNPAPAGGSQGAVEGHPDSTEGSGDSGNGADSPVPQSPPAGQPPPTSASPPSAVPPAAPGASLLRGRVLTPTGRSFDVEVVQDNESRQRGLQKRARLPKDQGMLFVFPRPGRHRFWMYECLIPLDIIWLDPRGKVIHIEPSLPVCHHLPCPDYGPGVDALYVLELGSGVAKQANLRLGDQIEILFGQPPNPT